MTDSFKECNHSGSMLVETDFGTETIHVTCEREINHDGCHLSSSGLEFTDDDLME